MDQAEARMIEQPEAGPVMPSAGDAEADIDVLRAVPRGFAIDSEEHANWLVKKVVAARMYAERVKAWADQEQRRATREEQTLMFLFGRQLEGWTRSEIARIKGRRRSISMPAGTVGFRTVGPTIQIDDEAGVIAWATTHCPSAVESMQKLARSVLKAHFEETGCIPDAGAHLQPGGDRFYLK